MLHLASGEDGAIQFLDFAIILVKLLVKCRSNAFYFKFRGKWDEVGFLSININIIYNICSLLVFRVPPPNSSSKN